MKTPIFLNGKGCALLAAIDSGLIPEQNGGYDTAPFEKFWSSYMDNLDHMYRASDTTEEMLGDHAKIELYDKHFYRNLILRSVSTMFIGSILMAFLKTLGLGSFIAGLLLCLFSVLSVKEI